MTVIAGTIAISTVSMNRAMQKVKELIPRGTHFTLDKSVFKINEWYMGWSGYYRMTQYPSQLVKIEAHIRRRLRARLIYQQKSKRNLFKKLVKQKVNRSLAAKTVYSNKGKWVLSHSPAVERAFSNLWFLEKVGLKSRIEKFLPHWFYVRKWIKLP